MIFKRSTRSFWDHITNHMKKKITQIKIWICLRNVFTVHKLDRITDIYCNVIAVNTKGETKNQYQNTCVFHPLRQTNDARINNMLICWNAHSKSHFRLVAKKRLFHKQIKCKTLSTTTKKNSTKSNFKTKIYLRLSRKEEI